MMEVLHSQQQQNYERKISQGGDNNNRKNRKTYNNNKDEISRRSSRRNLRSLDSTLPANDSLLTPDSFKNNNTHHPAPRLMLIESVEPSSSVSSTLQPTSLLTPLEVAPQATTTTVNQGRQLLAMIQEGTSGTSSNDTKKQIEIDLKNILEDMKKPAESISAPRPKSPPSSAAPTQTNESRISPSSKISPQQLTPTKNKTDVSSPRFAGLPSSPAPSALPLPSFEASATISVTERTSENLETSGIESPIHSSLSRSEMPSPPPVSVPQQQQQQRATQPRPTKLKPRELFKNGSNNSNNKKGGNKAQVYQPRTRSHSTGSSTDFEDIEPPVIENNPPMTTPLPPHNPHGPELRKTFSANNLSSAPVLSTSPPTHEPSLHHISNQLKSILNIQDP